MRDHVTEERISAYVDGELEGDELKLVERLLAESAEHRQLLAEFQALRASIWALPTFSLPADFHARVVGQIDASPAKERVRRPVRESQALSWRSVFLAAASLAAVVAVTVMLRPPRPIPDSPGSVTTGSVTTPVAMPVYFKQEPAYVMVYDVTVTRAGQENKAVDKLLKKLGIGIDPALRLDGKLEKELMAIRESQQVPGATEATRYKTDAGTPKSTVKDKVEMIYVASTLGVLSQVGTNLKAMSNQGEEVARLHYDLVIEPNKLGVMHRLHDSAREHFAHSTNIVPSDLGQAFRIAFRMELTSVSVPGAAAFPVLKIGPTSALSGSSSSRDTAGFDVNSDGAVTAADAAESISQLNQLGGEAGQDSGRQDSGNGVDQVGQPNNGALLPGHILLIIRNVGANAAAANAAGAK